MSCAYAPLYFDLPQADEAMALVMICNGRSRFDSNDRNAT